MLNIDISHLINRKNLLAFSAGVDSSALFFLLLENNIHFDIAIVDYGTRTQSKEEVLHAKTLAKKHKLFCHTIKAPNFDTHFEQKARNFRYEFFESLIHIEGYDNLLTAHQLNDQLEWLLMRLTKGAGLSELLGLEPLTKRATYYLVRPLLNYSKEELLGYLTRNKYPYFIDESNNDRKYERNLFRSQFSDTLIAHYQEGIKRSFTYLLKDKELLEKNFETIYTYKQFSVIKLHDVNTKEKAADLTLKKLGYLLSSAQRKQIKEENTLVIGGEWAVEIENDLLYISPYDTIDVPKKFREQYRLLKIPAKVRPYIFREKIDPTLFTVNT